MKLFTYYIFSFTIFLCFNIDLYAQQKRSKKPNISTQIKKGKKIQQKKTKKSKRSNKSSTKGKAIKNRSAGLNQKILLADLSKTITTPVANYQLSEQAPEKTITIISAFKPQLKNVAKINFGNAIIKEDTTTLELQYQVPSQNLTFQYRPISLVPRAIRFVQPVFSRNAIYAKLGYGNYYQSLLELGISNTDHKNNQHSLLVKYNAFQGTHHLQKANIFQSKYIGDLLLDTLNHLITELSVDYYKRYRYGLVPDTSLLSENNYIQKSTYIVSKFSWLNFSTRKKTIHFEPSVQLDYFVGESKESNIGIDLISPLYFTFKNNLRLNFDVSYRYSSYQNPSISRKQNDVFRVDPNVEIDAWKTNIILGASPTISNGEYAIYPNILFRKKLKDTNYVFTGGWKTTVHLNKYANLEKQNPWIEAPSILNNTSKESKFIKIIFNANKNIDYGFGVEINDYKNMLFFNKFKIPIDKSINGLVYEALFEPSAKTIELMAHFNYQISNRLIINNQFKYIQFNSIKENSKPWGVLPLLVESSAKWDASEKLTIDALAQFWTGATFANDLYYPYSTKNAFVLNAGLNYKLSKKWIAWFRGENLFDKSYERWGDYPSLGVQLNAGIVYSFRQ